jgi:glycosyltransferase involved in cell wall biosynthesis
MRILYASARAHIPDRIDGALYAAHTLLTMLKRRGHAVEAVASIGKQQPFRAHAYRAARALSGRRLLSLPDRRAGYVTWRAWEELITDVAAQRITAFRPDVLLTQLDGTEALAQVALAMQVPVLVWVHDNEFAFYTGSVRDDRLRALSATDFVADQLQARLGLTSDVLYPPVRLERCVAERHDRGEFVTFINPVKEKGVDIALAVARLLPHRRFQFVESWPLGQVRLEALQRALRDLPNVTLRRWSDDMRPVYARTRLLLAPSQWVEAFCTVVFEAHANGIPVVASRIGGIPTTLGEGGMLLDPKAAAVDWAVTVEAMLSDPQVYARMSTLARTNAARPEFDAGHIVDRFLAIARAHTGVAGRIAASA